MQIRIGNGPVQTVSPLIGCLPIFLILLLMCVLPVFLYDTARLAFERLGLSPAAAGVTVLGILVGSMINIPVYRIQKDELQPEASLGPMGMVLEKTYRRVQSNTLIAANVGGCLIPVGLAALQVYHLSKMGNGALLVALIVSTISIVVCWRIARPVEGIGILLPGFIPPLTSLLATWVLLSGASPEQRAATAFVAGVAGPLVGADLFHLREIMKTPVAMMSLGGAGTFDGIVLSGIVAALLA